MGEQKEDCFPTTNREYLALRDIIRIQQRRLRIMLTGKRLHDSQAENSQQQVFFDWLEGQQQWRETLNEQLAEQQSGQSGEQNQPFSI